MTTSAPFPLVVFVLGAMSFACSSGPKPTGPSGSSSSASSGSSLAGAASNVTTADSDGDGIADGVDKCPEVPEQKNGIDDDDGCPEIDTDRDGVLGSADKCPSEPEDKDGDEDDDGCPDVDGDKDGVADANDQCPDELETMNSYKDSDGCPDTIPPSLAKYVGTIKGIVFKSGSARLASSSKSILAAAAKVFVKYPDARLEIQGHTDNSGARQANIDLSQKRAESVRNYLVSKGVGKSQLVARGYGPDKPKSETDDQENRRVDFMLISE